MTNKPLALPRRRPPVAFTEAVALRVLDAVASGETITALSRRKGMPSEKTIWRWSRVHPEFAAALREARAVGAGAMGDRLAAMALELIDRGKRGVLRKGEAAAYREGSASLRYFLERWSPEFAEKRPAAGVQVVIHTTLALGDKPATADAEQHGYVVNARPALPKSDD